MTKIIHMPQGENRQIRLGKQAFEAGRYQEAREFFTTVLDDGHNWEVIVYLTETLMMLDEVDEAYSYILEFEKDFKLDPLASEIYLQVLLKKQYFLKVALMLPILEGELKQEYMTIYDRAVLYYNDIHSFQRKARLTKLEQLPNLKYTEQRVLFNEINFLGKEDFIYLAKKYVLDKSLSPLIKIQVLDYLARLDLVGELKFYDYKNDLASVLLEDVKPLSEVYEDSVVYEKVLEYIVDHEPSLFVVAKQTIKLHLGLVYPLDNLVMSDTKAFVGAYLDYFGVYGNLEKEQARVNAKAVLSKLDQLSVDIAMN